MSKAGRRRSADHGLPRSNPFDSDLKSGPKKTVNPERTSSAPITNDTNARSTLLGYNEDEGRYASSSASPFSHSVGAKNQYRNNFRDSGGLQNQTTEELGNYAYYKAEEVTKDVNNCLKIAEDIREDATRTLVSLHQQGEQITRTHVTAADIEIDLSRGEKLLGNLGGIFSKTWKPKKTRAISGPVISHGDMSKRKGSHFDQKERLGLLSNERQQSNSRQQPSSEPSTALEKVQVEMEKQDDALSGLSNVLDQLKDMAVDMGSELEWQNKAMDNMHDDVEELNIRVKGANLRGRRLLGK